MKSSIILPELLKFVEFTHRFQKIERTILATGLKRNENDAEHSFQMAIVCWFLIQTLRLKLSTNKVIAYCLTHDLVEIFAGDTYFYTSNTKLKNTKQAREEKAMKKIAKLFPKFVGMNKTIAEYEAKKNPEAKFVYAVDKVLPVINIYLDQGKSWKRDRVTYEMIRTKDEKVKVSKPVEKIWKDLVKKLDKNKKFFYEK